jgi:very-short-patch-repair endonuclease
MRGPNPKASTTSRKLRVNQTDAEKALWGKLRGRRLDGHKFVRQETVGRYICDFVCREKRIVIEVDGGQHAESTRDKIRDEFLVAEGFRVLRFWNNEVLSNMNGVLLTIQSECAESGPSPQPSPR